MLNVILIMAIWLNEYLLIELIKSKKVMCFMEMKHGYLYSGQTSDFLWYPHENIAATNSCGIDNQTL